ncbi:hypothetical protein KBC97_00845 [Candidatus Gracilibacteria bacterium]|nr:hypothetical protein [Candidatus Gracilibacteria bacterium]
MLDLSVIKNEKLRNLVKASRKFQALSEFQQQKHLDNMKSISSEKEESLCQFFTDENAKENDDMTNEEKMQILDQLYNEVLELGEKFTKLLKKEPEKKQRKKDDENMDDLLASLDK